MEQIWLPLLVAGVFIGLLLWFRMGGQLNRDKAVLLLKEGARVVDVRTPAEFAADGLPGALNIPLDGIAERAGVALPDKNQVLLLHCLSGGRSLIARGLLRRRGYTQVYNLGSVHRARTLLEQSER